MHGLDRLVEVGRFDVVVDEFGVESFRLTLHRLHEVGAEHAIGEAGEVLDLRRIDELAARCERACDDERLEPRASQIDGRRVSRGAGTDDDDVSNFTHALTIGAPRRLCHGIALGTRDAQNAWTELMYSWLPGRLSSGTHMMRSCVSMGFVNLTSVVPPSANVNSATCSPPVGLSAVAFA